MNKQINKIKYSNDLTEEFISLKIQLSPILDKYMMNSTELLYKMLDG